MQQEFIKPSLINTSVFIYISNCADESKSVDWHFHEEIEILWITEETKDVYIGNAFYTLHKNDIIFINGYIPHKTSTPKGNRTFLIQFNVNQFNLANRSFCRELDKPFYVFRNGSEENKILLARLDKISSEYINQKNSYQYFIVASVYEIVAILFRYRVLTDPDNYLNADIHRIQPVLNYVQKHYDKQIRLDEMCRLLNVNKSYFCRLFKNATSLSFMEFLYKTRLDAAVKLLLHSEKTITEISYEVGFSSPAYFTKVFRENKGYTPSFYKKLQKR